MSDWSARATWRGARRPATTKPCLAWLEVADDRLDLLELEQIRMRVAVGLGADRVDVVVVEPNAHAPGR
jgi:hypothetical protein